MRGNGTRRQKTRHAERAFNCLHRALDNESDDKGDELLYRALTELTNWLNRYGLHDQGDQSRPESMK
jgi:hypothetical protein